MKNCFIPIRIHMAATTFQQILSQFLEEETPFPRGKSAEKPELKREFTSYEPDFTWIPTLKPAAKKSAYKKSAPRVSEEKSAPTEAKIVPTPSEPAWEIGKLPPEAQLNVTILTRMGANFEGKISISLLKKAHRKLAKQLHPDFAKGSGEKFLELQSIYEELMETLTKLSSPAKAA